MEFSLVVDVLNYKMCDKALIISLTGNTRPPASEIGSLLALEHVWLIVRVVILLMM